MIDRKEIISQLREKRFTYKQIGSLLGISHQRVHQIYAGYRTRPISPDTKLPDGLETLSKEVIPFKTGLQGRDVFREYIRKRDNYVCQICGKKWEKGKRRFDVHHIDCDKNKTSKYDDRQKEKRNCITLCHKCHLNLPEHKKSIENGKIKNRK